REAIAYFHVERRRAEVRLWDVLWRLTDDAGQTEPSSPSRHWAVERATRLIEERIAEPIRPARLAREVGISHNHLIRLFDAELGATITGYVRQRRMARAQHLLTHSTLPIKNIAV